MISFHARMPFRRRKASTEATKHRANVDEQDAPALRALDCRLQDLPLHHGRAAQDTDPPLGVSRQKAVVWTVVEPMPSNEEDHRVGFLGPLQGVDGVEDVGCRRVVLPSGAVDEQALDDFVVGRAQPLFS
jgi:hypothetical protein